MITTGVKTKTAATANILTTNEAKTHLKVDWSDSDQNTYIDSLILSAQQQIEAYTNRFLGNEATFYFYLSDFPYDGIVLPFSPVKSITSVKYYDTDNSEQTWDSGNYFYNIYEEPCRINYVGDTHPTVYEYRSDAVVVEFVCAYTSPDTIPEGLKEAARLLVGDMYEQRIDNPREKFTAWKSLAFPHRVWHATRNNRYESW